MFYVNQRWLGGSLTNFTTIRKSITPAQELEEMKETGELRAASEEGSPGARPGAGEAR